MLRVLRRHEPREGQQGDREACVHHGLQGERGIACWDSGVGEVSDVHITRCKLSGISVIGAGSSVKVQGGTIEGPMEHHGVCCFRGGFADLKDVDRRLRQGGRPEFWQW